MAPILLRVDVDFAFGLRRGVPFLLRLFEKFEIRATFCVVMGPDTLSKHGSRVSKRGYLRRLRKFGLRNLAWHVAPSMLLRRIKPATVGMGHKKVLEKIVEGGHELSIHGYDHADWADRCLKYTAEETRYQVDAAVGEFRKMFGDREWAWVSPNWRCNGHLFDYLDSMGIAYSSDTRGCEPYYPQVGSRQFRVLQLPVSLPCLHELSQCGIGKTHWMRAVSRCLNTNYNHMNIHAYYEGLFERRAFASFLERFVREGMRFVPLRDGYDKTIESRAQPDALSLIKVPGGIGEVVCQRKFVSTNYFSKMYVSDPGEG